MYYNLSKISISILVGTTLSIMETFGYRAFNSPSIGGLETKRLFGIQSIANIGKLGSLLEVSR